MWWICLVVCGFVNCVCCVGFGGGFVRKTLVSIVLTLRMWEKSEVHPFPITSLSLDLNVFLGTDCRGDLISSCISTKGAILF